MTPLSLCALTSRERPLLRPVSVVRLLILTFAFTALMLMQTYLRFKTCDLEIESRKLQTRQAKLMNQQKALIAQVEGLKCYDTVREYAVSRLGLRECPLERVAHATVSTDSVKHWDEIARDMDRPDAKRSPCQEDILATVGGRMLALSSIASAREVEAE